MSGPEDLPPAGVPNAEAIAFFRSKGYRIGFNWQDVEATEHARAFTVAKAMNRDLLEEIRAEVDTALAEGKTFADFQKELRPRLEARGWWGRKTMLDPATGRMEKVQLGSKRRLRTIFDTNLRTAYAAGKWERAQRVKGAFPFLEYSTMEDARVRPEHVAWDGVIRHIDDPWWDTHYPPCDWNCRCTAIPRSQRMLDRQGKTVTETPPTFPKREVVNDRTGETAEIEEGIGKGWNHNVGKEYLRGLAPRPVPPSGTAPKAAAPGKDMTRGEQQLVDRFLDKFDIAPGREAIWKDRDGWPLSIGRGWFIGANGSVQLPKGSAGVAIDRIAAAIVTPDAIDWVWTEGQDGAAQLTRRYVRTIAGMMTIVDIMRGVWRWRIGKAAELAED